MPTRPLADAVLKATLDAMAAHQHVEEAAASVGMGKATFASRLGRAREWAKSSGYVSRCAPAKPVPSDGMSVTASGAEVSKITHEHVRTLADLVRELKFHPVRRWRFDLAWPDEKLAVEIQGGIWLQGHHSRGQGMTDDCEKTAHALMLGWRVLPVVPSQIESGEALQWIERILQSVNK